MAPHYNKFIVSPHFTRLARIPVRGHVFKPNLRTVVSDPLDPVLRRVSFEKRTGRRIVQRKISRFFGKSSLSKVDRVQSQRGHLPIFVKRLPMFKFSKRRRKRKKYRNLGESA